MFQSLVDSLDQGFRNLKGTGKISEKNIRDTLKQVRTALLDADVEYQVARNFVNLVKEKALGENVLKSVNPGQFFIKIFQDQLVHLLGDKEQGLVVDNHGSILLCGLNGAGKTTTAAKLALKLKKAGKNPLLVACDLYRPAAIEQLATLAQQIDVPCYCPESSEKDMVKVAKDALNWAKQQGDEYILLIDTAGRQEIDQVLVKELIALQKFIQAEEVLLVADSATGQKAVSVANHFNDAVNITGVILTKLDGDTRGGAALSMRAVTGKAIKFIGEGEKVDDLSIFYPDRLASRILDMGDVVSMVEKVADKINEKKALKTIQKIQKGSFDFNDFLENMKMFKRLGPLEGILGMLPGMAKLKKQIPEEVFDPKRLRKMEAIVLSMTPYERERPVLIKGTRRKRIANGSGNSLIEVNKFLRNFENMRKMMQSKGKMKQMMDQMLGGGSDGGAENASIMPTNMPDISELQQMLQNNKNMGNLFGPK